MLLDSTVSNSQVWNTSNVSTQRRVSHTSSLLAFMLWSLPILICNVNPNCQSFTGLTQLFPLFTQIVSLTSTCLYWGCNQQYLTWCKFCGFLVCWIALSKYVLWCKRSFGCLIFPASFLVVGRWQWSMLLVKYSDGTTQYENWWLHFELHFEFGIRTIQHAQKGMFPNPGFPKFCDSSSKTGTFTSLILNWEPTLCRGVSFGITVQIQTSGPTNCKQDIGPMYRKQQGVWGVVARSGGWSTSMCPMDGFHFTSNPDAPKFCVGNQKISYSWA